LEPRRTQPAVGERAQGTAVGRKLRP
jgi:hypothetical protein